MLTLALLSTNSDQNVRAAKRGGMTHEPLAARGDSSPASKPLYYDQTTVRRFNQPKYKNQMTH
jgi:hypothetical protein